MNRPRYLISILLIILSLSLVSAAQSGTTYVIRAGDTLIGIAIRFGTSVSEIVAANNISNPNLIFAGSVLIIPDGGGSPPAPTPPPSGSGNHIVQPGDTLSSLARRFGTTVAELAALNNLVNPNLIYVGQVLVLPGGSGSPAPSPGPAPSPSPAGFEVGGQTQSFANPGRMRDIGMRWVKFQHKWQAGDSAEAVRGLIRQGHDQGFNVLLSVTGANTYPSAGGINFAAFTSFLGGVAGLGADAPTAIEVWNEQNIDFEWPAGEISPSSYVNNMLRPAFNAIKAANNGIMVISGALAPTGFDNGHNAWADNRYIQGMASAGAANYADCIGIHHNAGATSPNANSGHPGGSHYSWYFKPMIDLYSGAFSGRKPLCFTEVGYLSAEGFSGIPTNFAWASETSVSEHAQWLSEAVTIANQGGRVRLFIIYNVDFTFYDASGDPQAGYAIIRPDGTCPACDRLSAVIPR